MTPTDAQVPGAALIDAIWAARVAYRDAHEGIEPPYVVISPEQVTEAKGYLPPIVFEAWSGFMDRMPALLILEVGQPVPAKIGPDCCVDVRPANWAAVVAQAMADFRGGSHDERDEELARTILVAVVPMIRAEIARQINSRRTSCAASIQWNGAIALAERIALEGRAGPDLADRRRGRVRGAALDLSPDLRKAASG